MSSDTRPPRARTLAREAASLLALVCVVGVGRASLADHYQVPTGSMIPTVQPGDHVVVDKRSYGLRVPLTQRWLWRGEGPHVGEVVVLLSPEDGTVLLKRVVAGPGDTLPAPGLVHGFHGHRLPPDRYLVMGDNRGNSHDGRAFGLVSGAAILGRALAVVYGRDGLGWRPL